MTDYEPQDGQQGPVVLGYGPMDEIHTEFEELVGAARTSPDADFAGWLTRVNAHLRAHFAEEDRWMQDTVFPPRECHMDEHAAVLRSAGEVEALVVGGNIAIGRSFVEELARWFPGHANFLDSALAAWMFKRQFGGKPVVLHRRSPAEP